MCLVFLTENAAAAARNTAVDSSVDLYETERKTLIQRIEFEKSRIANDFKSADSRFFNLIDSVTQFILQQPVSKDKRNNYLNRLQAFLGNIDQYYSDGYLKSGTYLALLSYYPVIIDWDQHGELLPNLKRYSSFSIKATKLIPNDSIVDDFLTDYMNDRPDDIFRYAEEFSDRACSMSVLERAAKRAPESAKRYYSNTNAVSDILRTSKDPFIKKSFEIYSKYGLRSRAYLLLDDISKSALSVDKADVVASNADVMFVLLVKQSMKKDANSAYSIYRYLDLYSVDRLRKMNLASGATEIEQFPQHTPEEMFVLMTYGFKDVPFPTFQNLFESLRNKCKNCALNSAVISSIDKGKMKDLLLYCESNQLLDQLLALVNDQQKNYLLSLITLEEKDALTPPFKTFTKDAQTNKFNASVAVSAQPLGGVAADNSEAEALPARQEEPVIEPKPKTPTDAMPTTGVSSIAATKGVDDAPVTAMANDSHRDALPVPAQDVEPIKIVLDQKTKTIIALKKNILQTIQNLPNVINKEYGEEVLLYAAQKEPDELFKKIDVFKSKFYCLKILEQCAINAPVSVKRYLYNPQHPVNYILQYSANPTVKKILEINTHLGYRSKPMLLIDDMVSGKLSVKDALAISAEPSKLFNAVVAIISRPKYIGKYSIDHEMRDYSLHFIREINDKIASGASQPFSSVEDFSSTDLYFLMLYGRDEVFTSTFNGLFTRFIQKLPKDGNTFLSTVSYNQFRDFISLCSNFGTIDDFLSKFSPDAKKKLLAAYISNLELEKDELSSIVLIAEALSNVNDNEVLANLQTDIKKEYERVKTSNNQVGMSIYGVLSSMISGNAKVDTKWYRMVSMQFKIAPASTLASGSLFNEASSCIEQMYFYNDDDGKGSFTNFMNSYKNQSAWMVEDKNSYIKISSKTGLNVQIYANKPEYEENGSNAITSYLKDKGLVPSVIVHRGHSFHTEATLEKIPQSTKLIFVGSCGGFYKIPMAMGNAPDAQVISTKQVGTKAINDAMLFALNENIRNGKDIDWAEFWDKMHDKLGNNQYFSDYVPPHKNLEATFIRAYYKTLGV